MHGCFESEAGWKRRDWGSLVLFSRHEGRGVIVVDHVAVRRGVWASGRAALGLDLQPRLAQRLGEVVVHRAGDGHRVCYGLGLLVVLAQAATEMLLDDGVTGGVR